MGVGQGEEKNHQTWKDSPVLYSFILNWCFWFVSTCFAGRFDPYVSGGVFDCAASTTSGWGTQLPRSRWPPPTRDLQALGGARRPQNIARCRFPWTCQPVPSAAAPSSTAAAASPWQPAWKTTEETLLRTPQAMYVREPPFPCISLWKMTKGN